MTRLRSYCIATIYWFVGLMLAPVVPALINACNLFHLTGTGCSAAPSIEVLLFLVLLFGAYLPIRTWLKHRVVESYRPEPPPYIFATGLYWAASGVAVFTAGLVLNCSASTTCTPRATFTLGPIIILPLFYAGLLFWMGRQPPSPELEGEGGESPLSTMIGSRTYWVRWLLATIVFWSTALWSSILIFLPHMHCEECASWQESALWTLAGAWVVSYLLLVWRLSHPRSRPF
jgi:hypothetical protein